MERTPAVYCRAVAPTPFRLTGPRPLVGLLDLPAPHTAPAGLPLPQPHTGAEIEPAPVVVLCPGFKGFAEWGFFPPLAGLLAERGFAAVRFNFGGSGMALGEDRVGDLEAFRRQTISGEVEDLLAMLASLRTLAPGRLDLGRVALFGHSRGGAIALLAAARLEAEQVAGLEPLRALVTWSAVSRFDRLSAEELRSWRESGTWLVVNTRTGQELPVGLELLRDIEAHGGELDPRRAAARRHVPWLLVHGDRDETVPFEEGETLAAAAAPPRELLRIAGTDHTFGTRTPFAGPNPHLIAALNATQTWLLRWMR